MKAPLLMARKWVRIEGTGEAGHVILRLLQALPASLLSGVDDVDEIVQFRKSEAEKLKALLYLPDVEKFLDQSARALQSNSAPGLGHCLQGCAPPLLSHLLRKGRTK